MSDAAQGEPRQHEVFSQPFKVEPAYESWPTPKNYRQCPGGKDLPDKLKVWRVQNTGKSYGSVAFYSYGFEDSPDAEILTPGYNEGKENGAVGVGRQGNFLGWGFCAPPSQMTEAGKHFFLNCICYIHKFDGQRPLVRRESSDRLTAVYWALLLKVIKDPKFSANRFPAEMMEQSKGDAEALARLYQDQIELIRYDKMFRPDEDLVRLGLKSNRKIETLQRLIALLDDTQEAPAARKLLARYTRESFQSPEEWQSWFKKNHDRIYFTDVGGYKFLVRPEGYLARPQTVP
jgi:hypothetical protein